MNDETERPETGADEAGVPAREAGSPARRIARAALLNGGALLATTAAYAAFEPKFPKLVGD